MTLAAVMIGTHGCSSAVPSVAMATSGTPVVANASPPLKRWALICRPYRDGRI